MLLIYIYVAVCTYVPCSTLCAVCSVQYVVSLLFASLCYLLISGHVFSMLFMFVFLFCTFTFYFVYLWFCTFLCTVLLVYIAEYLLFCYKFTDLCH